MVKRIDFEIVGIKGFEVKIEALEKSIWVLEKSWRVWTLCKYLLSCETVVLFTLQWHCFSHYVN